MFLLIQPKSALVESIGGGGTTVTVDDAGEFAATDSIRIRSADGSTTEIATILSVAANVITLTAALSNSYNPGSEDVRILHRDTIPAESVVTTSAGVTFSTLAAVTTGDANPVLDGESTFLGLTDKVWAECTTPGAAGNIDPESVIDFEPARPKVNAVINPERGDGGAGIETDFDVKYRAANTSQVLAQENRAMGGKPRSSRQLASASRDSVIAHRLDREHDPDQGPESQRRATVGVR